MAAGDFPDFYLANSFQYCADFAEAGYALDVSDAEFVQYLEESTLSSMTYNDALYGMPLTYSSIGVFYNKDLFKAAGIEEIPTTITGLREVCEKLNSYGVQPFSMSLQMGWIVYQDLCAIHTATLDDLNAFVSDMNQGGSMDTPKFRKALETFDLLNEYSNEDRWDSDYSAMTTLFAQEEAAMMIQGCWAIPNVLGVNDDLNIGMFAIPVSDDENANPPLCAGASAGVIVHPQSQYVDQCLDVLLWLANGNGKDLIGEYTGILTCSKDPYIPQDLSNVWTDTMEYVKHDNVVPIGYFSWVSGFDALAGAELQGYLLGELDMGQLMERLDEDWANCAN